MFLASLNILADRGEVEFAGNCDIGLVGKNPLAWRRQSVREVISEWVVSLDDKKLAIASRSLAGLFCSHEEEDYLGLLYQCLTIEGCKSAQGSYFTSTRLVKDAFANVKVPVKTFLDPCCGSGKFLFMRQRPFPWTRPAFSVLISIIQLYILPESSLLTCREKSSDRRFIRWILCRTCNWRIFCETNNQLGAIDL